MNKPLSQSETPFTRSRHEAEPHSAIVAIPANMAIEHILQALPEAIYTTDASGLITFYNEAAAELWGVRPELGKSEFCGSWKLYWPDGTPLPHDECPMAMALREKRPVRGLEAFAERPDGRRVRSGPFLHRSSTPRARWSVRSTCSSINRTLLSPTKPRSGSQL